MLGRMFPDLSPLQVEPNGILAIRAEQGSMDAAAGGPWRLVSFTGLP
jgi:hypothetical protein